MSSGPGQPPFRIHSRSPRMFLRQFRSRRPSPIISPYATSLPPPMDCDSYAALSSAIKRATGSASGMPTLALTERALRGEQLPYAALTHRVVPNTKHHVVDTYRGRVYGGRFVGPDGRRFVTSCQDYNIRVYATNGCEKSAAWTLTHVIRCDDVRWTITDFDVSPCGRWLAYSTINEYIHIVDLDDVTRQRRLDFAQHKSLLGAFGVMSVCWNHDGREIIVGTTGSNRAREGYVMAYNVETEKGVDAVCAHEEDVNSVCFLKDGERNLLLSGSDDAYGKMWDRREIRRQGKLGFAQPCAVFIGHCEGLTHMSTKNDGRFLISQAKDQCIKLWDIRKAATASDVESAGPPPKDPRWDYRFEQFPGRSMAASGFRNDAVMTYSGSHETLQTLIRSYFSPLHTTGQKYIYTGSSAGTCTIYDVLTGKTVDILRGHQAVTRDVSWHPLGPFLTTVSWDHHVVLWSTHAESSDSKRKCALRNFIQRVR